MSGNAEDEINDAGKMVPLDLARNQASTIKTNEGKPPSTIGQPQHLRNLRVFPQQSPSQNAPQTAPSVVITTNIIQPPIPLKPDSSSLGRSTTTSIISSSSQISGNITMQKPTQITLATSVPVAQTVPSGTTYHVPRGPAAVANLAAPRSNVVPAIRASMVVAAQTGQAHGFVRPPRTPSPAQGTAWLTTNCSNGSQIKGAPTVLSSPVRGATVTNLGTAGKPQLVARTQPVTQSAIRPTTAILHSAITIGQGAQLHSFKTGQGTTGIQAIGNAVTIAQVLPARTQAVVYSATSNAHFTSNPRLTVSSSVAAHRQLNNSRPVAHVTTARLTMPVNVTQSGARLVNPQAAVLTPGARLPAVPAGGQSAVIGTSATRLVSTTQTGQHGRIAVSVTNAGSAVSTGSILAQTRISTLSLHPLVVSTPGQRNVPGQKVIGQPTQGATIHLAQMPLKTTQSVVSTTGRTINVQSGAAVAQRQGSSVVTAAAIPVAKVIPQSDNQVTQQTANVYIHTPVAATIPRRSSPGPAVGSSQISGPTATTASSYSIANNAFYYEPTGTYSVAPRSFNQQATTFGAITQSAHQQQQPIRSSNIGAQVHGIVANQPMRFNHVMVVEQGRAQFSQHAQEQLQHEQPQPTVPKVTSSPPPSILRKRDHEGSPLKAAKNLTSVLASMPQQLQQQPPSPPSRPDSRGNGHSSGGSTTISATSSPGLAEGNEDSNLVPMNVKEEEDARPPPEMSPRKKPRKQQLTGNDLDENTGDMQFISENNAVKKEPHDDYSDEPKDGAPESKRLAAVRKPASASLLNSYRHNWKATHNHYLRYSDVRPKDERRPTIMDLANQYRVLDKVNGWKIHHLSTQMEDLADQEESVYNQLNELLKYTESEEGNKFNKDINIINELIKGNLQRIKIINDGMIEAKSQIMKIFDHKVHVTDIISRCASKRNFKKREKS